MRKKLMPFWIYFILFVTGDVLCLIFPVSTELRDMIKWRSFDFGSLCYVFTDGFWWTGFVVHFLLFWIGEEVKHYGQGHKKADSYF